MFVLHVQQILFGCRMCLSRANGDVAMLCAQADRSRSFEKVASGILRTYLKTPSTHRLCTEHCTSPDLQNWKCVSGPPRNAFCLFCVSVIMLCMHRVGSCWFASVHNVCSLVNVCFSFVS
jgi:hypothetical protein